jgi:hypothetical protein
VLLALGLVGYWRGKSIRANLVEEPTTQPVAAGGADAELVSTEG